MFKPKIKISSQLLEKLTIASEQAGASSVEEFANKILEEGADAALQQVARKVSAGSPSASEVNSIAEKLKGLGYLE